MENKGSEPAYQVIEKFLELLAAGQRIDNNFGKIDYEIAKDELAMALDDLIDRRATRIVNYHE